MQRTMNGVGVWLIAAASWLSLAGCGGSNSSEPSTSNEPASTVSAETSTSGGAASSSAAPAETKPLLEPFTAPPLAEIDAKAEWEDQRVVDTLELMKERQSKETPLATAEEALALRNTSPENNAKILSALGRLPTSDSQVNWDGAINRHARADVKSTNPLMMSSTIEFEVVGLTGFSLFGFDWNFNPLASADVVKSWQTSKDRMYDKVVMRDDLTWSDGKPITAHDVVFSFKTILDPEIPIPAVRSGTDEIRWIEAYDDHTLVYFHKKALATNVWNINFPVIPKHIYENSVPKDKTLTDSEYHVKFENDPVTGGPYVIKKRSRDQEIVLERRESWYMHNGQQVRPKPYFKEVRFNIILDDNTALLALKLGKIDEYMLQADAWQTKSGDDEFYKLNTKVTGVEWTNFYFCWNINTPYFSDKRVRQAMSYAYNYDEMLTHVLYGLYDRCNGPFHPDAWMAPKELPAPYTQNLDKAEQLLDEAGWSDHDGDGVRDKMIDGRSVPFQFSIITMNVPERKNVCTLLKDNLDQIGIRCDVKLLEFTVLQEKSRKHEFQALMAGWGTGTDPDTMENIFKTGEGRNYGEYSNPKIDELFAQGKVEFDREKRAAIYAQIYLQLVEDQPYTWLYFRNAFYGFNKKLRGYVFSPRGPYTYGPGFSSIYTPMQ